MYTDLAYVDSMTAIKLDPLVMKWTSARSTHSGQGA